MPAQSPEPQFQVHRYLEDTQLMCVQPTPAQPQTDGQVAMTGGAQTVPTQAPAQPQTDGQVAMTREAQSVPTQAAKEVFRTVIRPTNDAELTVKVAAIKLQDDQVLAAHVKDDVVEWEWGRAVAAIGMKTKKDSQFLKRNREHHTGELIAAAISQKQLMYNGDGSKTGIQAHCMNSSAFLLLILLVSSSRQLAPAAKQKALCLVIGLLQVGVKVLSCAESFLGQAYVKGQGYVSETLSVDKTGIVSGLYQLLQKHPAAMWAWTQLMKNAFCSEKITSSAAVPTLWDLVILLVWCKNNPTVKNCWKWFGQLLWPQTLWLCGRVLDALAMAQSSKPLEQLPLLKTAQGRGKRIPWVNKLVLLRKMRQIKQHRRNTMESHGDLVPKNAHLVRAKQFLCASIYAQKLRKAYEEAYHISIHWDPSGYDVETLVSIIFSTQAGGKDSEGLAAYLPIQNLKPVMKNEVCPEIQALSAQNKLTRISGFAEIRAVSHSLQAIGMPLSKFFLGKDVHWKRLGDFESRVFEDGLWWIVNSRTGTKHLQVPKDFCIATTPILTSITDQGGINRAGLDYLCWKLGMCLHIAFDPFHRSWNDLKQSLKTSKGDLFKCVLAYSLLYNVNYGPFNSKAWHEKKKQRAAELLETCSAHQEPFLSFIPFICMERQIAEPTSAAERENLFRSIGDLNSVRSLGPVVKLMRFYSFFQSEQFFDGEVWMNKLIMLETEKYTVTDGSDFIRSEETMAVPNHPGISDREQLKKLKAKHGSWGLAPLLVTPASFWQKNAIVVLAKPCWSAHAWMSKNLLTPAQSAKHTISQSQGGWKSEILELVLQGFLSTSALKKLYPFQSTSEATKQARLSIHYDFLVTLMGKRASSLSAFYCRPPIRYSALLSEKPFEVQSTQKAMQAEWKKIAKHEENDLNGSYVKGLDSLHFLHGCLPRLAFLLNERDCDQKTQEAAMLIKPLITNFGDTLCVENTHQSAKDCLNESRHNIRSRTCKQAAVINSRVFQTRMAEHISVSELELSTASAKGMPAFVPLTNPNSHRMQREYQEMMQHKSGQHFWPATSNASQFEEVAALEMLLNAPSAKVCLNCLAGKPGNLIASQSTSLVGLVISKSVSGVLIWAMESLSGMDPTTYRCIPKDTALQFHHIVTLDEWVEIPAHPVLLNEHGSLCLEKTGPGIPLGLARVKSGLELTVKEAKEVLAACNVYLPGQPNKAQVYKAVVEQFLKAEDEIHQALALSSAKGKMAEEDEDDDKLSEYQDLLDLVEEDTENKNDPDIKGEKEKVKRQKQKVAIEGHILLGAQKKGRGRGRGKGAGKGKGRGRGKGKEVAGKFASKQARGRGKGRGRGAKKAETPPIEGEQHSQPEPLPQGGQPPQAEPSPAQCEDLAEELLEPTSPADDFAPTSPVDAHPPIQPGPSQQAETALEGHATKAEEALASAADFAEAPASHTEVPAPAAADLAEEPASHTEVPAPAAADLAEEPASHTEVPAPAAADLAEEPASHTEVPAPAAADLAEEPASHTEVPAPAEASASHTEAPAPAAADLAEEPAAHTEVPAPAEASASHTEAPAPAAADLAEEPASHTEVPAPAEASASHTKAPASVAGLSEPPASKPRGPNLHQSPLILQQICPPGCSFRLNRYLVKFSIPWFPFLDAKQTS